MRTLPAFAALLLILPAAGCKSGIFSRPYAPYSQTSPDTLVGQCERAAYNDPTVQEMMIKAAGTGSIQEYWAQKVKDARMASVQRCMLQRGGPDSGGGVEFPRN